MEDPVRSFFVNGTVRQGFVLLFVIFLLQGCFPYTSSFIADPTSKKTSRGIDPVAAVTRQPVIIVEEMPSAVKPAVPLTVRAAERVTGPEVETTTVNEYKYKRHWSPFLIPWGALQLVTTPFICLGAAFDPNPEDAAKVLDDVFAGMNEKRCDTKGWARQGTYFILGINPSCEVRASTTTRETKPTGRSVSEERPYESAALRMTVSPRFAEEGAQRDSLSSREIALGRSGRAEINVASLFRQYSRPPHEVDILLSLESPAQAAERIVIDRETSEALFLPVREERAAEQAEGTGNKAAALEHYGKAYAALSDREREGLLWKKIVTLYRSMQPKPAVPDEARRYMVRGQSAVQEATSPKDFDAAAKEFETAARKAPFWPDAYYNLAVLQGKLGRYDEAITNLQRYLDLLPDARDAEQVKNMIYQFDYKKTKTGATPEPNRAVRWP